MPGALPAAMYPIAPGPHGQPGQYPGQQPGQYPAPHGPGQAMPARAGGRRPGLIVLGVVLLLGGGISAFSCTVWQESLEGTLQRERDLTRERSEQADRVDRAALDETQKKLDVERGFSAESELYRNATGGGGAVGLLGGVALIAFGARKRKA